MVGAIRSPRSVALGAGLVTLLLGLSGGCRLGSQPPPSTPRSPTASASPTPPATPSPTPTSPAPPPPSPSPQPERPVTVEGGGRGSSASFTLRGGDYSVAYTLAGECVYFGQLRSPAGPTWPIEFSPRSGPTRGGTTLRGVPPGDYVVDVTTGPAPACPWVVTLSQS